MAQKSVGMLCYRPPLPVSVIYSALMPAGLNHLRPFWDFGLDAAGKFFRRGVDCIKAQRRELLSSFRLNHRLADLAVEQFDNGRRRVGGDKNARHCIGLLTPAIRLPPLSSRQAAPAFVLASSRPKHATFLP